MNSSSLDACSEIFSFMLQVNPFAPEAHFRYSLNTSENCKGALGTNGLREYLYVFVSLKFCCHKSNQFVLPWTHDAN